MNQSDWESVVDAAARASLAYLQSLPERRVQPSVDQEPIRHLFDAPLPGGGEAPESVIANLARDLDPFITAHASGRYFGFVIGGLHPAAYGADVLAAAWDQNAGLHAVAPGVGVIEAVAARWIIELLRLPAEAAVGFVTGGQMASFTCLAAARHHVLREWSGWDVEADGLIGAPEVHVVVKSERHDTIPRALRFLGLGGRRVVEVASDSQSRMVVGDLEQALAGLSGPTIVCLESGNLNTGSFDRFEEVAVVVDKHRGRGNPTWVHVDGAVGLWARAVEEALTFGLELMDSWSTDAHKLLNVGYDSGIAITRHPASHRAAMGVRAAYLVQGSGEVRDQLDWNPEFSRRARGLAVYAVLRSLGSVGVTALVERTQRLANRFADRLGSSGMAEVMNEVVFNQILIRWIHPDGDDDGLVERVIQRVAESGIAFFSPTTWNGRRLMRISVSDWASDEGDVDRAIESLLSAAKQG
jgi:glutamate/tyrosine decarboxylase-like PLP-dependent enzyme